MVEFVHPLAQFAQGAMGGAQMGLQVEQAQRLRKQQDWENDYRMMTTGLHLASLRGNTPDMQNKLLQQSVAPVWKKWTGQDFPAMDPGDPESVKGIGQLVKDLTAYGEQMAKGKIGHDEVYRLANERIADYHAGLRQQADVSEREKAAIESIMAPIKGAYEVSQSVEKKGAGEGGGADSPSKIKAEIFRKYMGQGLDKLSPQEKSLIADDIQDPAFRIALTAYGQNLMNMGNKPEEQLAQLQAMTRTIRAAIDEQAGGAGTRAGVMAPGEPAPAAPLASGPEAEPGGGLPPQAVQALQAAKGQPVTFQNGQTWMVENGIPKRVK